MKHRVVESMKGTHTLDIAKGHQFTFEGEQKGCIW